ncbi:MAG: dipeptide epimerase [Candidatus Symbiopectobacterium sp. Dall1.0]|nr:dipeptide epimerase [Candidatus Symbiopectobacterium sp. Dall1.0]
MRQMQVETVKLSLARPCKRAQELRNAVSVVRITFEEQGFIGLGECTPAFEYQESAASVCRQLDAVRGAVTRGAQVIKLKLDRSDIVEKIAAVRDAAPRATLMVDATESWAGLDLLSLCHALLPYNIALIEQPLPAGKDQELLRFSHPIPLCADESCRHAGDIPGIRRLYEMINIKLDKCGGLTEALAMVREARLHGLKLMVGCLVGSSLAMEAALPVAAADYVDLDGR